jgi:XTP/dITP diphosphohydrolase
LEKNATEKSSVIYNLINKDCFSEDTGLEVDELNGEPGVRSARYAHETSFNNNIDKLLFNLDNKINRQAQFKTIISLMFKGEEYKFEGICKGIIIARRRGGKGFGYDPVFVPAGSTKTFAEMTMKEKQIFSHRGKAVEKLIEFLKKH